MLRTPSGHGSWANINPSCARVCAKGHDEVRSPTHMIEPCMKVSLSSFEDFLPALVYHFRWFLSRLWPFLRGSWFWPFQPTERVVCLMRPAGLLDSSWRSSRV